VKIVHANISDVKGGASVAAYRLHQALMDEGVESLMMVQTKKGDEQSIIGPSNKFEAIINLFRPALDLIPLNIRRIKPTSYFFLSWLPFSKIPKKINDLKPDLVHLHWICGGMLSIKDLLKIQAPIVWSLHDNWAFTGGCHIMWDCEKYKNECGNCPILQSNKKNDLSNQIFKIKEDVYSKKNNLNINAVSKWMAKCVEESLLLKSKKVYQLPNLIDTQIYTTHLNKDSKVLWGIDERKKTILFGAYKSTTDKNKGYDLLTKATEKLNHENYELVVYGSEKLNNQLEFKIKTHFVGFIDDQTSLVSLYNAVDVMVVPSLQESFGQTAIEAMSCKIPVVAFGATGLLDIVDHKVNGYLAQPYDTNDLARGIDWVLKAPNYDELCENARKKVLKEFDSKIIAKKYIAMYKDILTQS